MSPVAFTPQPMVNSGTTLEAFAALRDLAGFSAQSAQVATTNPWMNHPMNCRCTLCA